LSIGEEPGTATRAGDDVTRAYATLRSLILNLSLEPGRRVSQLELSRLSGAGRTPLREALRMLEQ
jgi:DNA-binding GntR family transcriptional regulator